MLLKFSDHRFGKKIEERNDERKDIKLVLPNLSKKKDLKKIITSSDLSRCENCRHEMEPELFDQKNFQEFSGTLRIESCSHCSWWIITRSHFEYTHSGYAETTAYYYSILKKFRADLSDATFMAINNELIKTPSRVKDLHHKTFELFVGDLLARSYNCKVIHVGKTNDGGADLFLIDDDKKTVVQVKRRKTDGKVESVKLLRELIGTMVDFESSHGMLVSTASNYSKATILKANDLIERKKVESITLINRGEFFEILQLMNNKKDKLWEPLINSIWPKRDFMDDF